MQGPTFVKDSCQQLVLRETASLLKATRNTVLCLPQGEYRQRLLSGPSTVGQLHLRPFQQEDLSGAWLAQSANGSYTGSTKRSIPYDPYPMRATRTIHTMIHGRSIGDPHRTYARGTPYPHARSLPSCASRPSRRRFTFCPGLLVRASLLPWTRGLLQSTQSLRFDPYPYYGTRPFVLCAPME